MKGLRWLASSIDFGPWGFRTARPVAVWNLEKALVIFIWWGPLSGWLWTFVPRASVVWRIIVRMRCLRVKGRYVGDRHRFAGAPR